MVTDEEKEMYLLFCGWTVERGRGAEPVVLQLSRRLRPSLARTHGDHRPLSGGHDSWDSWWYPPKDSPINKKYSMTRSVDNAFKWQKMVDNFEWKHRNY
jgi:hypothetical protein